MLGESRGVFSSWELNIRVFMLQRALWHGFVAYPGYGHIEMKEEESTQKQRED